MFFLRRLSTQKSSALGERFQQILDEKLSTTGHSSIANNPELVKLKDAQLADAAEQKAFEHKYQREIGHVKSQNTTQYGKNIQLDVPWTGSETVSNTATRMLLDSLPKAKPTKYQATIFTPAVGLKDRIEGAKEGALDYKISSPTEKEREDFREQYKERLLGPSMFVDTSSPKATLGLIGGLADSRINAAIDRKTGKFDSGDMESVRGKPLDKARLANCSDTNFFLNEILNKQECLPPWIENQQGVERELSHFRNELNKTLFTMILDNLRHRCGESDDKIAQLMKDDGAEICRTVRSRFLQEKSSYYSAKVTDLNRGIRNYNLQCPTGALHKWKVVGDTELNDRLKHLSDNFGTLFESYRARRDAKSPTPSAPPKSLFSFGSGAKTSDPAQGRSSSIWVSIRSKFIS